jgi:SAM-dependent methyltransferase
VERAVFKQRTKQAVRRTIGEPYVGKRLKLRRLNRIMPTLALRPAAILDAGTEEATFVYWLADRYPDATVTAVDIDRDAISACVAARPDSYRSRVEFRLSTFAELEDESFDLITVLDVLEHIHDDAAAVAELARALKAGGTIVVHVPRDRWMTRTGEVHRVADEDAWRINPGHVRQGYSPESLRQLLTGGGLTVEDVQVWLGRWGVLAFRAYSALEHPTPLRLLSVPVTDLCAVLDQRRPTPEGNSVYARATKPGG